MILKLRYSLDIYAHLKIQENRSTKTHECLGLFEAQVPLQTTGVVGEAKD